MSKTQKRKIEKNRKMKRLRKVMACAALFAALGFGANAMAQQTDVTPNTANSVVGDTITKVTDVSAGVVADYSENGGAGHIGTATTDVGTTDLIDLGFNVTDDIEIGTATTFGTAGTIGLYVIDNDGTVSSVAGKELSFTDITIDATGSGNAGFLSGFTFAENGNNDGFNAASLTGGKITVTNNAAAQTSGMVIAGNVLGNITLTGGMDIQGGAIVNGFSASVIGEGPDAATGTQVSIDLGDLNIVTDAVGIGQAVFITGIAGESTLQVGKVTLDGNNVYGFHNNGTIGAGSSFIASSITANATDTAIGIQSLDNDGTISVDGQSDGVGIAELGKDFGIVVIANNALAQTAGGILLNDAGTTMEGDIEVVSGIYARTSGTNSAAYGINIVADEFSGTITTGALDIANTGAGPAQGIVINALNTTGAIATSDISVSAASGLATGIRLLQGNAADITVTGDIDAYSNGAHVTANALGIYIQGDNTAKVTVTKGIEATSFDGNASAVFITGESGKVSIGEGVSAATNGVGNAYVLYFGDITDEVAVGEDISAYAYGSGNAHGIFGGNVTAAGSINVTGDILATAYGGGTATGVELNNILANVTINDITADSSSDDDDAGNATGFTAANLGDGVGANATVSLGDVVVTSEAFDDIASYGYGNAGSATGVQLANIMTGSELTVKSVNAQAIADVSYGYTSGDASGIVLTGNNAGSISVTDSTEVIPGLEFGIVAGAQGGDDADATGLSIDGDNLGTINIASGILATSQAGDATGLAIVGDVVDNTIDYGKIFVGVEEGDDESDAIGLYVGGINNAAGLTTSGDILAQNNGEGYATGILGGSFGTGGLIVKDTITATSADGDAFAIADWDGTKSSQVTLKGDAVLDTTDSNTLTFGVRFAEVEDGATCVVKRLTFDTADFDGQWDNGQNVLNTENATQIVFAEDAKVKVDGIHWMQRGKDTFGLDTESSITLKNGSEVVIDGRQADYLVGFLTPNAAGTMTVERGAKLDGYGKTMDPSVATIASNAVIVGKLDVQGEATFRGQGSDNKGLFVNAGGAPDAITVGTYAKLNADTTHGERNTLYQVADGEWADAEYATTKFDLNEFYNLAAVNIGGNGYIGIDVRDVVYMPEMYALGSQMHHYRSIADAAGYRFALDRQVGKSCSPCNEATSCDPCEAVCGGSKARKGLWASWTGRTNEDLRSTSMGHKMRYESDGVQVGFDFIRTGRFMLGGMYGYSESRLYAQDGYGSKMKGDDNYFGLYGQYLLKNGLDVSGTIGYGRQEFDHFRNNKWGQHTGDFKSDTFEANLELGYMMNLNKRSFIRPLIGIDVYNYDTDGMVESSGYVFHGSSLTQAFFRVGAEGEWTRKRFALNGGVFYSYQMNKDAKYAWAAVTDPSQGGITAPTAYKLGRSIVTLNLGGRYALNQSGSLSLFGGYQADIYTDRINDQATHSGTAGIRWEF